ncbi:fluoride efflux transporter CrcB [Spirosoma radiotolerans]|nr:fluoride efflux transporter CrcB [Spirosoma radiotolerans]
MILRLVLSASIPVFRKFANMRALLMNAYVLVFFGGGLGSVLRYALGRLIPVTFASSPFPTAILLVNVVASFVLGAIVSWVIGRSAGEEARLLIGVGFCGGLSTFSSFSNDTVLLAQNGRLGAALLNIGLNVILCLVASAAGLWFGQKL